MKQRLLFLSLLVMLMGVGVKGWGQFGIETGGTDYTQNFNTLTTGTWTNNSTLLGWYAKTDATSSITSYAANTGSTTSAGLYAFGVAGTNQLTDRALGYAPSNAYTGAAGTGKGYIGWRIKNNTGSNITSLTVKWTGEQWRKENNATSHAINLFYQTSTTVTDLTNGTWTSASSTFTSPIVGATTATALDGNAPANRSVDITTNIIVNIPSGEEIMLRWEDLNDASNDHYMAIDDVTINATVSALSNPTITLNPNSLSDFSYIQGSGPSTVQTFTVSGSNLTADISIAAPTNYEISKTSGSGYTSPLSFAESGGTVSETTVYVRLKAGLSAGTYNSEVITASSTDADNKTVTCSGKVLSPEPTTSASVLSFTSVTATGFTINWTNGNGSNRLVLVKSGSAVDADPVDGTSYSANTAFGSGTQIGTGNYVVYNSTGSSVTVTGLTSSTTYHVEVFEFNGSGGTENYLTSSTISGNQQTTTIPLGWQISSVNTPFVIDFDNTVEGVNNGQFVGNGFTTSPSTGQLNSNAWAVSGWSEASLAYGGSNTSGDFARGISTGNVTTGGIYAFTVSTSNNAFGFQPGSGDWAPGTLTLKFQNQSGVSITDIHVSYLVYVRNDQGRSSNFNFSHSSDNSSYTAISDIDLTSGEVADGTPSWKSMRRILKLSGLNLSNGSFYYFKWSGSDVGGSGSRDEFALDDITIVANPTSNLSISGTYSELVLSSTAASLVQQSNTLTISGNLTNNAAEGIVLKSPLDHGAPGSLIVNGSISGSGTIKAERYIQAYSAGGNGWHLISSPVNNVNIASGTNLAPGGTDDLYAFNETAYEWTNYKPGNVFTTMDNGKGYLVSYAAAATKQFVGTPNNAAVTFTNLSKTAGQGNGWHLIGNPFQSAISWNNGGWTLTNIGGVAKRMSDAGSYTDVQANDIIPAMQGFFVQVENATNTLTIPLSARTHNSAQNWTKSGSANTLLLVAHDPSQAMYQESRLNENPAATEAYDYQYDSRFVPWYAPEFYSISGNEMLSTNSVPDFSSDDVIPFGFKKNGSAAFYIELKESPAGLTTYLTDTKTGIEHNFADNAIYSFTAAEADSPTRFLLHFGAVGVSEQPESSTLKAYVVGGQLYFQLQGEALLEVVDMQGRVVQQTKVSGQGLTSSSFAQPAGAYVVRLVGSRSVQTAKVIVKQ